MLWTLQSYIFRELGKTFLLTATGLTVIVSLGGGVANIIGLGEVTPGLLMKIMLLVLPIAAAFTLPVAALFSATVTYGRLSADNELTACRASGVNIHRLLAPCLLISIFSAVITFISFSFVVPGLIREMNELARADLLRLLQAGLKKPSRLGLWNNRYRIYADRVDPLRISPEQAAGGMSGALRLQGAAFVKLGAEEWELFGFAEHVDILLTTEEGVPVIRAATSGGSAYDRRISRWGDVGPMPIGRLEVPREIPRKVKWLTLPELLYHRRHPDELQEIRTGVNKLRGVLAEALFYEWAAQHVRAGQPLELAGDAGRYILRAADVTSDPDEGKPTLKGVTIQEVPPRRFHTIQSGRATLDFDRQDNAFSQVVINTYDDVVLHDPLDPTRSSPKKRERLDPVPLPLEVQEAANKLDVQQLTHLSALPSFGTPDAGPGPGLPKALAKGVEKLRFDLSRARREIIGVLMQRLAFSISVLVLGILGACLAIVWRGAHLLVAFGISFVPSLFVIATIIAGKQLSNGPVTAPFGLLLMWSGIAVVAGLDVWVLTRVLRR